MLRVLIEMFVNTGADVRTGLHPVVLSGGMVGWLDLRETSMRITEH